MKLKFPQHITSLSVGEVNYTPDAEGCADFDPAHVADARAFGFEAAPEAAAPQKEPGILDGNVEEITKSLKDVEDLDALEADERKGKTRKGVLDAIEAERKRRAG